jgi:hypothetical protein
MKPVLDTVVKRRACDREPHREEREQGIDLDCVLDLDERDAPDRGDDDEREERH